MLDNAIQEQPTVITNPDELTATPPSSPFISFISAKTHTVLDKIVCDGQPGDGPNATGGIEKPVWDGARGKFYINIPSSSTTTNDDEVDEIDPVTMTITSPHSVSQRDRRSCPGPDPGTGADQQLRRSDRYCVRERDPPGHHHTSSLRGAAALATGSSGSSSITCPVSRLSWQLPLPRRHNWCWGGRNAAFRFHHRESWTRSAWCLTLGLSGVRLIRSAAPKRFPAETGESRIGTEGIGLGVHSDIEQ